MVPYLASPAWSVLVRRLHLLSFQIRLKYSADLSTFSAWWRSNDERDLEVVHLHQPAGRRRHDGRSLLHSQRASSEERKSDLQGTSGSTGHSRHIHLRSLHGVSLTRTAMGRLDLSLE